MNKETADRLSTIRKAMAAALREKPKNFAEYHRLGDEHREILHAANPDMKALWEASKAREAAK